MDGLKPKDCFFFYNIPGTTPCRDSETLFRQAVKKYRNSALREIIGVTLLLQNHTEDPRYARFYREWINRNNRLGTNFGSGDELRQYYHRIYAAAAPTPAEIASINEMQLQYIRSGASTQPPAERQTQSHHKA